MYSNRKYFISGEDRFKTLNGFSDLLKINHNYNNYTIKPKDHLEGGIGKFISAKPINRKKKDASQFYNPEYYKIKKKFKYVYNKLDFTQRVLCPENNIEIEPYVNRFKKCKSQERNSLNSNGPFCSLMLKTPKLFINTKGKKRMNRSYESTNRGFFELSFCDKNEETYNMDNKRLSRIDRIHRNNEINYKYNMGPYQFQKKHFSSNQNLITSMQ